MRKSRFTETEYDADGRVLFRRVSGPVKTGISFGSGLAMVISFVTWKSVGWAIVHGILGWFYVVYYLIRYN